MAAARHRPPVQDPDVRSRDLSTHPAPDHGHAHARAAWPRAARVRGRGPLRARLPRRRVPARDARARRASAPARRHAGPDRRLRRLRGRRVSRGGRVRGAQPDRLRAAAAAGAGACAARDHPQPGALQRRVRAARRLRRVPPAHVDPGRVLRPRPSARPRLGWRDQRPRLGRSAALRCGARRPVRVRHGRLRGPLVGVRTRASDRRAPGVPPDNRRRPASGARRADRRVRRGGAPRGGAARAAPRRPPAPLRPRARSARGPDARALERLPRHGAAARRRDRRGRRVHRRAHAGRRRARAARSPTSCGSTPRRTAPSSSARCCTTSARSPSRSRSSTSPASSTTANGP